MSDQKEYKCPSCGAPLVFNSDIQKMKCEYCGTEVEMEALKAYDEQLKEEKPEQMTWEEQEENSWDEQEVRGMRTYVCQSCAGELTTDANTIATNCPYCGNQVVLMNRVSGMQRPEYVIPFKMNHDAAKAAYRNHLKGKHFLPKQFKEEGQINKIQGIYVPFWVFNADADASIHYTATRTSVRRKGDYTYTNTKYYKIYREGDMRFDHIPVDGSSKMPDDLMESIEPFSFEDAVDFQTAYLSGFFADKYDVGMDLCKDRANTRIRNSVSQEFRNTVIGYSSVTEERNSIQLHGGSYHYVLYPVWILNTFWNDKTYTFAMNGQTGKLVGDLPMDKKAFWLCEIGLSAGLTAVIFLVLFLMWYL